MSPEAPRPASPPEGDSAAGPLKYGGERVGLAVSLDTAARSERDGWAALRHGEISKPVPPDTRIGTVDANRLLVVPANRVVARREGGRYRPVFLVEARLAGDPRTLETLRRASAGGSEAVPRRPVARRDLRPTRFVAGWVRGFLYVHVVLAMVLVGLALVGVGRGETQPLAERDLFPYAGFSVLQSALLAVSGIVWIVWQHRLHSNLLRLGAAPIPRSAALGVLWWLVPIANLVMPYVVMRRLWKAGARMGTALGVSDPAPRPSLGLWWAAWVVSAVVGLGGLGAETGGEILLWGSASNAALVVAGTIALGLVRGIQRQHAGIVGATA